MMTKKHKTPQEDALPQSAEQAQQKAADMEKEGNDEALLADDAGDALQRLQAELEELQGKNAMLADQYLRARAEVENTHRRAEEEVSKARKFGIESFAEGLLPISDSLDAALASSEATVEQLREGLQAIARQFSAALERNRVLPVNPAAGERFDPNFHQAISMIPGDQEPNTVIGVLQKGYTIADRVLRPALVSVAGPAQK